MRYALLPALILSPFPFLHNVEWLVRPGLPSRVYSGSPERWTPPPYWWSRIASAGLLSGEVCPLLSLGLLYCSPRCDFSHLDGSGIAQRVEHHTRDSHEHDLPLFGIRPPPAHISRREALWAGIRAFYRACTLVLPCRKIYSYHGKRTIGTTARPVILEPAGSDQPPSTDYSTSSPNDQPQSSW